MDGIMSQLWDKLGLVGLVIGAMGTVIWKLDKKEDKLTEEHRKDRNEWVKNTMAQGDKMMDVVDRNTSAMTEISTLIKSGK